MRLSRLRSVPIFAKVVLIFGQESSPSAPPSLEYGGMRSYRAVA